VLHLAGDAGDHPGLGPGRLDGLVELRLSGQRAGARLLALAVHRLAAHRAVHQHAPLLHLDRADRERRLLHQRFHRFAPRAGNRGLRPHQRLRAFVRHLALDFNGLPFQLHVQPSLYPFERG